METALQYFYAFDESQILVCKIFENQIIILEQKNVNMVANPFRLNQPTQNRFNVHTNRYINHIPANLK